MIKNSLPTAKTSLYIVQNKRPFFLDNKIINVIIPVLYRLIF
jgi:hypothetical protein